MHPQLEEYQNHFRSLRSQATALVADVEDDLLTTPPDEDTWSVAQVFDHLNTAGWLLLNPLEEAIRDGHENGRYGEPPFRYGFVSRWFVRSMRPSSGWTFSAPTVYEPVSPETLYADEVVEEFRALQDQFASCVGEAETLDLRSIRVTSPAIPLFRISLGAWFEATLAHEDRHLEQARTILQKFGAEAKAG